MLVEGIATGPSGPTVVNAWLGLAGTASRSKKTSRRTVATLILYRLAEVARQM